MTSSARARTNRHYAPSTVAILRALVPNRPLSFAEACRIAERQATKLLELTGSNSAPISEGIITELPRLRVRRATNLIGSGATAWSRGCWHVRINAAEPITRQRFTLAHELKHILDASCEDVIYGHLNEVASRTRHIEAVCDQFAACLLMPKLPLRKLWYGGVQDLAGLAWRFEVSQAAMLIRLQTLGLVDPLPRCLTERRLGALAVRSCHNSRRHFHRRMTTTHQVRDERSQAPTALPLPVGVMP